MIAAPNKEPVQNSWSLSSLTEFVADSVRNAREGGVPFYHLEFDRVFPADFYAEMLRTMPDENDYRPMSGKSKVGSAVWDLVGRVLRSDEVKAALIQHLGPGLKRRFGENFVAVGMYPVPILTRDIPGYRVFKHTDSLWKGITVQLYLPSDNSHTHIGTIFHEELPDGSKPKRTQMPFAPNTGYAFAVWNDTWHSAKPVGPEVKTRDSILLTYFVDRGVWRTLRNRGRRVGNFLLNELRSLKRS